MVAAVHLALGFNWLIGLHELRVRYSQGIASQRPYAYFVWANVGAWLVSCSPLLAVGIVRAVRVLGRWRRELVVIRSGGGAAWVVWGARRAVGRPVRTEQGRDRAHLAQLRGCCLDDDGSDPWPMGALDAPRCGGVGDRGESPSRYRLVIFSSRCYSTTLKSFRESSDSSALSITEVMIMPQCAA